MRNEELGISTAALLGQRHFSRGVERGRGLYSDPGEAVLYPIWPPMTRATTSSARVHRGRSTDPGHDAIRRKPNFLFHQHLPQIQSQKRRCPARHRCSSKVGQNSTGTVFPEPFCRTPDRRKVSVNCYRIMWCVQSGRPDSNRRRPAWEASILATELRPQYFQLTLSF